MDPLRAVRDGAESSSSRRRPRAEGSGAQEGSPWHSASSRLRDRVSRVPASHAADCDRRRTRPPARSPRGVKKRLGTKGGGGSSRLAEARPPPRRGCEWLRSVVPRLRPGGMRTENGGIEVPLLEDAHPDPSPRPHLTTRTCCEQQEPPSAGARPRLAPASIDVGRLRGSASTAHRRRHAVSLVGGKLIGRTREFPLLASGHERGRCNPIGSASVSWAWVCDAVATTSPSGTAR